VALNFGENVLDIEGTGFADFIKTGDFMSLKKLAPQTEFISAAPIIEALRSIKTQEELANLRNVCKATIEILELLPDWVKVGMTEKEVKAKLEYEYVKLGQPSFASIVATGVHSADPHHNTSLKKIEKGVLLIDSGLQIDEMSSDITRTFWVGANPPEDFVNAYSALYDAKSVANDYFTDGTPKNLPPLKCRDHLTAKGYDHEKLFFHGLGHALGFSVHDIGGSVSWKVPETNKFKENMVYTNEPGLYWRGKWGIRLEDDVIVGKSKCEQVTKVSEIPVLL
jgi:Xaa-Pro aminopeptidase